MEELVGCKADSIAHTSDCTKGIGAWTKVGPLAEFFERVLFLLKRVIRSACKAHDAQARCGHLGGLALPLASLEFAFDDDARADGQSQHVRFVVRKFCVGDDL